MAEYMFYHLEVLLLEGVPPKEEKGGFSKFAENKSLLDNVPLTSWDTQPRSRR
jgi:hypothetical protein